MKTIFVPPNEWNAHYESPEQHVAKGHEFGESDEGSEFQLVRLEVGPMHTYRIVTGKPVQIAIAFPSEIKDTP